MDVLLNFQTPQQQAAEESLVTQLVTIGQTGVPNDVKTGLRKILEQVGVSDSILRSSDFLHKRSRIARHAVAGDTNLTADIHDLLQYIKAEETQLTKPKPPPPERQRQTPEQKQTDLEQALLQGLGLAYIGYIGTVEGRRKLNSSTLRDRARDVMYQLMMLERQDLMIGRDRFESLLTTLAEQLGRNDKVTKPTKRQLETFNERMREQYIRLKKAQQEVGIANMRSRARRQVRKMQDSNEPIEVFKSFKKIKKGLEVESPERLVLPDVKKKRSRSAEKRPKPKKPVKPVSQTPRVEKSFNMAGGRKRPPKFTVPKPKGARNRAPRRISTEDQRTLATLLKEPFNPERQAAYQEQLQQKSALLKDRRIMVKDAAGKNVPLKDVFDMLAKKAAEYDQAAKLYKQQRAEAEAQKQKPKPPELPEPEEQKIDDGDAEEKDSEAPAKVKTYPSHPKWRPGHGILTGDKKDIKSFTTPDGKVKWYRNVKWSDGKKTVPGEVMRSYPFDKREDAVQFRHWLRNKVGATFKKDLPEDVRKYLRVIPIGSANSAKKSTHHTYFKVYDDLPPPPDLHDARGCILL